MNKHTQTIVFNPTTSAARHAMLPRIASLALLLCLPAFGISYNSQMVTTWQPPASGCVLPASMSAFLTSNNTVYLYFQAVVSNSDSLSNDWVAPDGSILQGRTYARASGYYCFANHSLAISNLPPSQLGVWRARVWDNGVFLFAVTFTVSAPPSQQQWDQKIISTGVRGYSYNLGIYEQLLYYSGQECKPWVNSVVYSASNGAISLPATLSNNYQWGYGPHVTPVSFNQSSLQPGWIIQARLASSGGPHTAIILATSNSGSNQGIWFLDSNWVNHSKPPTYNSLWVGIHFMTWQNFYSTFSQYTIYQITL